MVKSFKCGIVQRKRCVMWRELQDQVWRFSVFKEGRKKGRDVLYGFIVRVAEKRKENEEISVFRGEKARRVAEKKEGNEENSAPRGEKARRVAEKKPIINGLTIYVCQGVVNKQLVKI